LVFSAEAKPTPTKLCKSILNIIEREYEVLQMEVFLNRPMNSRGEKLKPFRIPDLSYGRGVPEVFELNCSRMDWLQACEVKKVFQSF
jgi:hypothetical protein